MMNKNIEQARESLRSEKAEKQQELLKILNEISNQLKQLMSAIQEKHGIGMKSQVSLQESLNHFQATLSSQIKTFIDGQSDSNSELQNTWKSLNQNLRSSISDCISKTAKSTTFYVLKITLPILLLLFCGTVYQIHLLGGVGKVLTRDEFPALKQSIETLEKSNEEMKKMIENSQKWKVSQHPKMLAVETPDQWIYLLTKNGLVEELRVNEDWACVQVDRVEKKE